MLDLQAVERLATDQASLKAAAGLVKPGKWSGVGASGDGALVWGECSGSGANPYRVCADLRDLGAKCTCPSRKFPCKHALALLWLRAGAVVAFAPADTPAWVGEWLGRRRGGARPAEASAPKDMAAARAEAPPAEAAAKREAASAKRAEGTERAVLGALDALEDWIGDQLRLGLGPFLDEVGQRCRRIGARLVDGKAPALAGRVDELPARLLAMPADDRVRGAAVELGRLVLLARAYRAAPADPELRRAVVAAEARDAVLADPAAPRVVDLWEVLAERIRTRRDGLVTHATWLMRLSPDPVPPRFALLLDFFPASAGRRAGAWDPGGRFAGELAFFPARRPLRAVLVHRERVDAAPPWPDAPDPERALADRALEEPWAIERPILLPAGRVAVDDAGGAWWRPRDGAPLPMAGGPEGALLGGELDRAAAIWSGGRLDLLAATGAWGRLHGVE